LLSTLAKQERMRISERVKAGLEKSRRNGRIGGRPALDNGVIDKINSMKSSGRTIVDIAKTLGVSRGSVYQYLQQ
jgi:DNA invertase Pin-like site-specific DNA recombinase